MTLKLTLPTGRFRWSAFQGRCRVRLLAGLFLLVLAVGYASFAGQRLSGRGNDDKGFDTPLIRLAHALTPLPVPMRGIQPQNDRELYLIAVISDQQDVMFGLTALVLRMIGSVVIGGVGLVLLAAGSTEWEIRSEA
jgi:hypothetical protein